MAKKHKHSPNRHHEFLSPDNKRIKDEITRFKLEKELKSLKGEGVKHVEPLETPAERKVKKELEELNSKREKLKGQKGFSAFLGKAKLNYEINQNNSYLSNERKIRNLGQQVKLKDLQVSTIKKEEELRNTRKKLNEIDIFGQSFEPPKKIDLKDLI